MVYSQNKNNSNNLIMKRLIFLLLFVNTILISLAQDKSEHLSFKGVPIDGTLNEYVAKMKAAGFSYLGTQDGTAILQGDFAGFKSCTVGVSTLKAVNVVSTIGVIMLSAMVSGSLLYIPMIQQAAVIRKHHPPKK